MCGRYASSKSPDDLVEIFEVDRFDPADELPPDWNIAPTKQVYAVLERPVESGGAPARQLRPVKWGLVPSWAKDPGMGAKMINARSETVHEKPAYRKAFAARRCLLPADGYFEWHTPETAPDGPKGASRKQPYWIHAADGAEVAFAGLYEWWRDRSRADDDPLGWLWTCTILTLDADPELARIHHRMPLVLTRDKWDEWLDPAWTEPGEIRGLLVPPPTGFMTARPVSTDVNNVRNNAPHLLEAIPQDEVTVDATLF